MDQITSFELIKIIFLLSYLSLNAYYDVRLRKIFGDTKFHLIVISVATSFIVVSYLIEPSHDFLHVILAILVFTFFKMIKKIRTGDYIVLSISCVILPSTQLLQPFPLFTLPLTLGLFFVAFLCQSIVLNIMEYVNYRTVFGGANLPLIKKIIYFSFVHRKRSWETFVIPFNVAKKGSLVKHETDLQLSIQNGQIVSSLFPFTLFILLSNILVLSMDFHILPRF